MFRLIAVTLSICGVAIVAWAQSGRIECGGARLVTAEREICATPGLSRLNDEIVETTERLKALLTGADRDALVDTEAPFVAQRNDCSNRRQDVRACVERVLRGRMSALTAALSTPASIRGEVTQYTVLSAPFLQKYNEGLVGRRVSVFGCMTLEQVRTPAGRTRGTIRETCDGGVSVPALFSVMDDAQAAWFDKVMPSSHWAGVVERRDGQVVLVGVER